MSIDWLQRMRAAGVPPEQAEAIASGPDQRYITREYLDARLEALEHRLTDTLTVRMLGIAGLLVLLVGVIDRFVRP